MDRPEKPKGKGAAAGEVCWTDIRYNAPLERMFYHVSTPFQALVRQKAFSGALLIFASLLAIVAVNSPLAGFYQDFVDTKITLAIGWWSLEESLRLWVNDGLMGIFFLAVGLEIKREILVGELSSGQKAALPFIAALGGMLAPALIFVMINPAKPEIYGWGAPMATDIAFVIGALSLLGSRIPTSMYVFLISLAIVDDLGAALVIALFYSHDFSEVFLIWAGGLFALLVFFNLVGVRRPVYYYLAGALLWFAMLKSGIHATMAGVLVAVTVPARSKIVPFLFSRQMAELIDLYDREHRHPTDAREDDQQASLIGLIKKNTALMETPMHRILDQLRTPVAFFIMPVFAFMNAGVVVEPGSWGATFAHPVTWGVMMALVFGKLIGVLFSSWLAVKGGLARLPSGMGWRHMTGASLLAGIGFTMSIFIASLGYRYEPELLALAKTGVITASIAAGLCGYLFLRLTLPLSWRSEEKGPVLQNFEPVAHPTDRGNPET